MTTPLPFVPVPVAKRHKDDYLAMQLTRESFSYVVHWIRSTKSESFLDSFHYPENSPGISIGFNMCFYDSEGNPAFDAPVLVGDWVIYNETDECFIFPCRDVDFKKNWKVLAKETPLQELKNEIEEWIAAEREILARKESEDPAAAKQALITLSIVLDLIGEKE